MPLNNSSDATRRNYQEKTSASIAKKEKRKLRARANSRRSVWFGLGMMGLVGWSVALPTVIGVAIGVYLDRHWSSPHSCTLTCLFVGLVAGCAIAWYWIKREFTAATDAMETHEDCTQERGEPQ